MFNGNLEDNFMALLFIKRSDRKKLAKTDYKDTGKIIIPYLGTKRKAKARGIKLFDKYGNPTN